MLRQMVRTIAPEPAPVTPTRTLRLAAERAMELSIGLAASVAWVELDEGQIDGLTASLQGDAMITMLERRAQPSGYVACDNQMRAALIEHQTTGRVRPRDAPGRPVTATDRALVRPLLLALIPEVVSVCAATELGDWVTDISLGDAIDAPRRLPMTLPDRPYRVIRLSLTLAEGRIGQIQIAFAQKDAPAKPVTPKQSDWTVQLQSQVMAAPTEITAVLHRMSLSLEAIEGLQIGQLLPLPGATVAHVRVEGRDRELLLQGRLGQISGQRAVRVEPAAPRTLQEVPVPGTTPALENGNG